MSNEKSPVKKPRSKKTSNPSNAFANLSKDFEKRIKKLKLDARPEVIAALMTKAHQRVLEILDDEAGLVEMCRAIYIDELERQRREMESLCDNAKPSTAPTPETT